MPLSGVGLVYATTGGILLWSGIKGEPVAQTIREIASGKQPSGADSQQINTSAAPAATSSSGPGGGSGATVATDSTIANDAQGYVGHRYLYGGAPGADGSKPWDCSSFCNWVLGHDFGMVLPGASSPGYSGLSHGPNTVMYLAWGRARTVGHTASAAQAGDLCVWQTHMGIALGGGKMVSALNESLGTRVTTISGGSPAGEVLFVRRITG